MNELLEPKSANKLTKEKEYHPYLYHLKKIKWFIFGSLTWSRECRRSLSYSAECKRRIDFNDLIAAFCGDFKLRPRNLAYYKATEYGAGPEPHLHFLIAQNGCEGLSAVECAKALEDLWQSYLCPFDLIDLGIGKAVIKPYDEAKEYPAVKYCLEREFDDAGREWERYDFLSPRLMKIIPVV